MSETIAGIEIPDSTLVKATTEFVRDVASPLLYNHSRRVFLWGSLRGRELGVKADPELVYVGAMFHDIGLVPAYRTERRFELDGADEARRFLASQGVTGAEADLVWTAIALHDTPEVPLYMAPEIQLVTRGVEYDVLGIGYDRVSDADRAAVVAAHPRPNFKNEALAAFADGVRDRPASTFGNVLGDVLAHLAPEIERSDFVQEVLASAWPE